jgi:hypothetical protein
MRPGHFPMCDSTVASNARPKIRGGGKPELNLAAGGLVPMRIAHYR